MKSTPENDVKKSIKDLLAHLHIFNFHVLQGMGAYPGIPDRIAIHNGMFIGIEAKAPGKNQSPKQLDFQAKAVAAGAKIIVVRTPEDLIRGLGVEDMFLRF